MNMFQMEQEIRKEIKSMNDPTEFESIQASIAKLRAQLKKFNVSQTGFYPDVDLTKNKSSILQKSSTESTQDFCYSQYSNDSRDDDVTTRQSVEHTNAESEFEETHCRDDTDMEAKDSHTEEYTENSDNVILIKDEDYLQQHRYDDEEEVEGEEEEEEDEEEVQEHNVSPSTFKPYGDWAEKRKQACERQRVQRMERELKLQARIEKRRNQLRAEVMNEMKSLKPVWAEKKEEDNEMKSTSSSTSLPYGDWAEKRKQACERQRIQRMERELKLQAKIEKRRNQLRAEVKNEMKSLKTVWAEKKEEDNEMKSTSSSTSLPYGDWAEKRKQACERQRIQRMERELKLQARVEKRRNQLRAEVMNEMKSLETVLTRKKEEDNEMKSTSSSTSLPYGDWAEKRKQACERRDNAFRDTSTDMMDRELKMQARLKEHRDRVKKEARSNSDSYLKRLMQRRMRDKVYEAE